MSNILLLLFLWVAACWDLAASLDLLASRRSFVLVGGALSSSLLTASSDQDDGPSSLQQEPRYNPTIVNAGDNNDWKASVTTNLGKSRILTTELSPLPRSPLDSVSSLFAPQPELYYPSFMFGEWNTTATLKQQIYPYGRTDSFPFPSSFTTTQLPFRLDTAVVGDTCTYPLCYFSTLANTLQNQLVVNLGTGIPTTQIIADRAFNVASVWNAGGSRQPQQPAVVDWDYRRDPTRAVVRYKGDRTTTQLVWEARASETDSETNSVFCATERTRVVGDTTTLTTETVTEYHRCPDDADHVTGVSRFAVHGTPPPNNNQAAVALWDYTLDLRRVKETFVVSGADGRTTTQERACVTTPNNIVQCY